MIIQKKIVIILIINQKKKKFRLKLISSKLIKQMKMKLKLNPYWKEKMR